MPVALDASPGALDRMRQNIATLDQPIAFCQRYLRLRGFHRQARDFDDLLAVAAESLVKAALVWVDRPDGVAFTTWAYRYMDREVLRELARDRRRAADMLPESQGDARWLAYEPATAAYRQVEDRAELADLVDRANLSQVQRFALWFAAVHGGSDGPAPSGHRALGRLTGGTHYKTGIRRVRKVVAGNTLNDDWAAARARLRAEQEVEAYRRAEQYRAGKVRARTEPKERTVA